jgi:hypothetical protein
MCLLMISIIYAGLARCHNPASRMCMTNITQIYSYSMSRNRLLRCRAMQKARLFDVCICRYISTPMI